jgi:hypothetical protein
MQRKGKKDVELDTKEGKDSSVRNHLIIFHKILFIPKPAQALSSVRVDFEVCR